MTAVALTLSPRGLSRRQSVILACVIAAVAALLYFEYRTFADSPAATNQTDPDTICMASRIGLPCR